MKVKYGLKNVHYAMINEVNGIISYGTPKALRGAINLAQNAVGDPVTLHADDIVFFEESTNNGYEGTLEMALINDEFRVDVLGDELDSNGALIENSDAKTKKIALMYEFDGDVKKTRHVNYYVNVSRPAINGSTKTTTKTPNTDTLNITARPRIDTLDVKAKVAQGQAGYDTFFTAVYVKNAAVNTIAATTATFSKAVPGDLTIDATSTDGTNKVKNVMLDGVNIAGVNLTVTGVDVTIDSAFIAALDNDTYTITVEFEKGNAVNIELTVAA